MGLLSTLSTQSMKIQPLFSNILIEIAKAKEVTKSGIILNSERDKKTEVAVVIATGDAVEKVKKGDSIIFKGYSADAVIIEDIEYSFIKEEEILAIL